MGTPTRWLYGPWRSLTQSAPTPQVGESASPTRSVYSVLNQTPGEGGGREGPSPASGGWGQTKEGYTGLTGAPPGGWGSLGVSDYASLATTLGNLGYGLAMGAVPGPIGAFGPVKAVSTVLGKVFGSAPRMAQARSLTDVDINDIRNTYGEFAAREAEAARDAARNAKEAAMAEARRGGIMGQTGPGAPSEPSPEETAKSLSAGLGPGSELGPGGAPDASTPSAEQGTPEGAAPGSTGEPGGGGGNTGGGGMDSSASGADGGYWARGGVSTASRGPRRAVYGEAGPEKAIFVPKMMERPGNQGREESVVRALLETLGQLRR
jgi:hypothetical protein